MIVATVLSLAGGAHAESNMPDIGDMGAWTTETNQKLFVNSISGDVEKFADLGSKQNVDSYVPIEAKAGLMFMSAFSHIAHILESSLVRFTMIFIIMMYILWMMMEAHNIIIGKAKTEEAIKSILKKGAIVGAWVTVLSIGPAKTFMMVMTPIMSVAAYASDLILNSVIQTVGANLPDTCSAIHQFAKENMEAHNLLSPDAAASIMCIPTRISGFAYSAIKVGWLWILTGFGKSPAAITIGATTIIGFIYLAWKFAFIALGVIADLFLGIIMLPFTAIAETVSKTSYNL